MLSDIHQEFQISLQTLQKTGITQLCFTNNSLTSNNSCSLKCGNFIKKKSSCINPCKSQHFRFCKGPWRAFQSADAPVLYFSKCSFNTKRDYLLPKTTVKEFPQGLNLVKLSEFIFLFSLTFLNKIQIRSAWKKPTSSKE